MKFLTTTAVATALVALSSNAFAETLDYNFQMEITSIADGYGVFDDLSEGGYINVSVQFDTLADGDGVAVIKVEELDFVSTGTWQSSWSDVQFNSGDVSWDAYSGIVAGNLVVNGVEIHSGSVHQEVYLDFAISNLGQLMPTSGSMNIGVYNGSSAYLTGKLVPPPTSVPELDPKSGSAALALVGGGVAIALSRRRRDGDFVPA